MNKSESIVEISKALIKAQINLNNIATSKTNPFYKSKYAPLQDILNTVKPILFNHGLAIVQTLSSESDTVNITTMLIHTSGEYIVDTLKLRPTKNDPQSAGSAITYGRRYSVSSFLNISSEDDDDGNANVEKKTTKSKPKKTMILEQIAEIFKSGYFNDEEINTARDEARKAKTDKDLNAILVKYQSELNKRKNAKPPEKDIIKKAEEIFEGKADDNFVDDVPSEANQKDLDIF